MPYKDKELGRQKARERYQRYKQFITKEGRQANWARYYAQPEHQEKMKARQKERYRAYPVRHLLYAAKQRAAKFNVPFDISEHDIEMPTCCPVFGTPFVIGDRDLAPSIDRINPVKGYVKGNVAVISFRANRLKQNMSLEEMRKLLAWLESVSEPEDFGVEPNTVFKHVPAEESVI